MITNTRSENSVLVSVGIPVRNGGKTLKLAIESVINQTYRNIEIIISDNNSSDDTEEICKEFVDKDSRISYYRQDSTIAAIANFRFVFDKSKGKYFMWAAHDDFRSTNYIDTLLSGFNSCPSASISFSDAVMFGDYENYLHYPVLTSGDICNDFETQGISFIKKHSKQVKSYCLHVYGLINSTYLTDYSWFDIDYGPDLLILHWLLGQGDFIYTPGCTLYYFKILGNNSNDNKQVQIYSQQAKPFPIINFTFACIKSIKSAEIKNNCSHDFFTYTYLFFLIYFARQGGLIGFTKGIIYQLSPLTLKLIWKRLKPLLNKKSDVSAIKNR